MSKTLPYDLPTLSRSLVAAGMIFILGGEAKAEFDKRSLWVAAVAASTAYNIKKCGPSNLESLRASGHANGFVPSTDGEVTEMQSLSLDMLKDYRSTGRTKWCWQMKNVIGLGL